MMDAAFIIFLSFLLFVGLVGYYGIRPFIALLDHWIGTIREELHDTRVAFQTIQEKYAETMSRLETVRKEGKSLQDSAQDDLVRLSLQTEKEFKHLLELKEAEHTAKIQQIFQERVKLLRQGIFRQALLLFENRVLKEMPTESLEAYNTQAIAQMGRLNQ